MGWEAAMRKRNRPLSTWRREGMASLAVLLAASCPCLAASQGEPASPQGALVTIDAKDAEIQTFAEALAQVAGLQAVFDPGVRCRFTVSVREVSWETVFDACMDACGLGYEVEGPVVRIAKRSTLQAEARDRRRLTEAQSRGGDRLSLVRLSYARAREMAVLLRGVLGPDVRVTFDERTKTLIIAN